MSDSPDEFDAILEAAQRYDGTHWLRILGQTHWQYDELPFWVLLKERDQIFEAIPVLQRLLRPLQDHSGADITVAFITFEGDLDCSHAYFKGEEFFAKGALAEIDSEPICRKRESRVFDDAYPNDAWALKSEPRK